jgi:uncharacterized protein (DUF2141 family)
LAILPRLLLFGAIGSIGAASAAQQSATADLDISIGGLRNSNGTLMMCLTRRPQQQFLACAQDPARKTMTVRVAAMKRIAFHGLEPGEYSLLVVHDENGNGKMDKTMGIPREGFGFSRNPAIRMGPPRYQDVHFTVHAGRSSQAIKLKYLL